MNLELAGKIALVTGGSKGIGRAAALRFAEEGASVAVCARGIEALGETSALARKIEGAKVLPIEADLTRLEDIRRVVQRCIDEFGRIDILVNNAGIHRRGTPDDYQAQDLADVFAVNLVGCYQMAGAVGKVMLAQHRGSIINVSALGGGLVGLGRGGSIYAMTKGGIVSLTRDLAAQWGRQGIRVNAVAPGWIRTPMTSALQDDSQRSAKVLERVPLRRWGEPEDVAGVVVFLASDAAAYVTGCTIPIDGGAANVIAISEE